MSVKKAFSNRKFVNWEQNVSITSSDLTNIGNLRIEEVAELQQRLFTDAKDLLIESSVAQIVQSGIPAMTVDVNPLTAINGTNGETSITDSVEIGFPLDASDPGQDRIDIIEIRLTFEKSDILTRKVVDPSDGSVSNENKETRQTANVEIQAITGTPAGSPVAPAKTGTDWIKISEIFVGTAVTIILNADIKNVDAFLHGENTDWTTEEDITGLFKNDAAMARRGIEPWSPLVDYKLNDIFYFGADLYRVVTAAGFTSTANFDDNISDIALLSGSLSGIDANAIINPSGKIFQRADIGTPVVDSQIGAGLLTDGGYFVDRWKVVSSTAIAEVIAGQRDSTDSFFVNSGTPTNKKIGILQWISFENTKKFLSANGGSGKASLSFFVNHNFGSALDIRIALIEATDGADTPDNDPISGWGTAKPTLTAGNVYSELAAGGEPGDTNFSIPTGAGFTRVVIEDIDIVACDNLGMFIFLPTDTTVQTEWAFRDVQLSPASSIQSFSRRHFAEELDLAMFYFERFAGVDTGGSDGDGDIMALGFTASTVLSSFHLQFIRKRIAPTLSSSAGTTFRVVNGDQIGIVGIAMTFARPTPFGAEVDLSHLTIGGPNTDLPVYLVVQDGAIANIDVDSEI